MTGLATMLRQVEAWLREVAAEVAADTKLPVVEAADFVTGRRADFARLVLERGAINEPIRREPGEDYVSFITRLQAHGAVTEARFAVVGGVDPDFDPMASASSGEPPPRDAIAPPDGALHPDQRLALRLVLDERRSILRAGRRWGKSTLCIAILVDEAMCGHYAGYVAPLYKLARPVFEALVVILRSILLTKDRNQGLIKLTTGAELDVWTVEAGGVIGRGRKYHRLVLDEIAHVLDSAGMPLIWSSALQPTLLDYRGNVTAASTPNGVSPANWFFVIANSIDLGWHEHHAPSSANPSLPADELADIQRRTHPLVPRDLTADTRSL
jgi:hypothetical protein